MQIQPGWTLRSVDTETVKEAMPTECGRLVEGLVQDAILHSISNQMCLGKNQLHVLGSSVCLLLFTGNESLNEVKILKSSWLCLCAYHFFCFKSE